MPVLESINAVADMLDARNPADLLPCLHASSQLLYARNVFYVQELTYEPYPYRMDMHRRRTQARMLELVPEYALMTYGREVRGGKPLRSTCIRGQRPAVSVSGTEHPHAFLAGPPQHDNPPLHACQARSFAQQRGRCPSFAAHHRLPVTEPDGVRTCGHSPLLLDTPGAVVNEARVSEGFRAAVNHKALLRYAIVAFAGH